MARQIDVQALAKDLERRDRHDTDIAVVQSSTGWHVVLIVDGAYGREAAEDVAQDLRERVAL